MKNSAKESLKSVYYAIFESHLNKAVSFILDSWTFRFFRSWTSNFKQTSPLQMITNQLKENMIQGLLFGYYMLSTKFIIIKGWLHCLTSESNRRFLVSTVLLGSAWCLVITQIQFSLKNKIGLSEHLRQPPTLLSLTKIHFYLTPIPRSVEGKVSGST